MRSWGRNGFDVAPICSRKPGIKILHFFKIIRIRIFSFCSATMTHMVSGYPLPFRSTATLHQRCHPISKQIRAFWYVNYVEDHSLVSLHVVHGEVEPQTKSGVASVRPDEQIVLEFRDKVHPAQVASLERGVEADVPFLRLPAMAWRSYYHLVHVAQSSFRIAVFALCAMINDPFEFPLWRSEKKIFEKSDATSDKRNEFRLKI